MVTPLRQEREKRGLTRTAVALELNIDNSHYSRIEKGQAAPSKKMAEEIARYFGHAVTEMQVMYPERYVIQDKEVA